MPLDRQSSVNVQVGAAHLPGPGAVLAGPGVPRLTAAMLVIRVIGELDVRLAGATAELPASRRARALLSWLAVHPGRHSRSRLRRVPGHRARQHRAGGRGPAGGPAGGAAAA